MKTLLALMVFACVLSASSNSIIISDKSGSAQTNFPVQIARPFLQGEIPNFPQALVNGTPTATQADVKQRYSDGSVKHSILSFLIPTLAANGTVTVTFVDQASGNNSPLTKAQMLDAAYDFDAVMELTNGTTKTASARTMLNNGDFTYWTQGPIATTVIIADHSVNAAYDLGFDAYKPFRPIFHATFWPGINKVTVRFIGELSNTEAIEDVVVTNLVLKTGSASPSTVYTLPTAKSPLTMYGATRWTKTFWIGGTPTNKINIDHNLAYLKETRFFPNYDVSMKIPEATIAAQYASWGTLAKDLYDNGGWCKGMGTTGGRGDIGFLTDWTTQWLYTGDYRSQERAFAMADLAPAWALQVREGDATKFLDTAHTIPALGHPTNCYARPTLWIFDNRVLPNAADAVNAVGPKTTGGWDYDDAHQPDPFSAQYILTGDFFYLEELQFWVSFYTMGFNPGTASYCKGPLGVAGINGQIRGEAWLFRNRVNAAFISPDSTPEKTVLTYAVNDAVSIWEGDNLVTGTPFQGNKAWIWGSTLGQQYLPPTPSTFRWWVPGGTHNGVELATQFGIDTTRCYSAECQWQNYFMMVSLGAAKEKGFATGPLLSFLAPMLIAQCQEPGYDRYLLASYYAPVTDHSKQYFTSWAASMAGWANYNAATVKTTFDNYSKDASHGYSTIATGAAAFIAADSNGKASFDWLKSVVRDANLAIHTANPKWAFLPRDTTGVSVENIAVRANAPLSLQVSPNPFYSSINIQMNGSHGNVAVRLSVYDVMGRQVADLTDKIRNRNVLWNAAHMPSGVYMVKLTAGNRTVARKISLMK